MRPQISKSLLSGRRRNWTARSWFSPRSLTPLRNTGDDLQQAFKEISKQDGYGSGSTEFYQTDFDFANSGFSFCSNLKLILTLAPTFCQLWLQNPELQYLIIYYFGVHIEYPTI